MIRAAAFFLLISTLMAQPPVHVCFGDSTHPAASGEVWLIAHQWGWYPAVLVAAIRNGKLEPVSGWEPRTSGWNEPAEYKLLVALSERALPLRDLRETDSAYVQGEFVKPFPYLILSAPLDTKRRGQDWPAALDRMGTTTGGDTLTLPRPGPRTIRLLYPDGRPLAGTNIAVSLFGSTYNHCGFPAGFPVGSYETDANGRIQLTAPAGPLALSQSYYDEKTAGPAGVAFELQGDVVTGPEPDITLRKWWDLPRRAYLLSLRKSSGQPLTGAHLSGCLRANVCGAICGPIPLIAAASDRSGLLRFEAHDLRSMETITIANAAGEERALSEPDMRQLMTTHGLTFTWR